MENTEKLSPKRITMSKLGRSRERDERCYWHGHRTVGCMKENLRGKARGREPKEEVVVVGGNWETDG